MSEDDPTPIPNTPLPALPPPAVISSLPPPSGEVEAVTPEPSTPPEDTEREPTLEPLEAVAASVDDLVDITRTGMRRMIGLSILMLVAAGVLALLVYLQNERSARMADQVADTQNTLAEAIAVLRETKREVQQTQQVVSVAADEAKKQPDISIQQTDAGVRGKPPQYEVVIKQPVRPPVIKAPDGGELKPPAAPAEVKIPLKVEGAAAAIQPPPATSAAPEAP